MLTEDSDRDSPSALLRAAYWLLHAAEQDQANMVTLHLLAGELTDLAMNQQLDSFSDGKITLDSFAPVQLQTLAVACEHLARDARRRLRQIDPLRNEEPPRHERAVATSRIDASRARDVLLLAGVDVSLDAITGWTREQRADATAWASAIHLVASDNTRVTVPPKPAFLP